MNKAAYLFLFLIILFCCNLLAETYKITDAYWQGDVTDADCDGYFSTGYRELIVIASVNEVGSYAVIIEVAFFTSGGVLVHLESQTGVLFNLISNPTGTFVFALNSFSFKLAHNQYNIVINLYKLGSGTVQDSRDSADDPDLGNLNFETHNEDDPVILPNFDKVYWSDEVDPDHDGYILKKSINVIISILDPLPCPSYTYSYCFYISVRDKGYYHACPLEFPGSSPATSWSLIVGPSYYPSITNDYFEFGEYDLSIRCRVHYQLGLSSETYYDVYNHPEMMDKQKFETEAQNKSKIYCKQLIWASPPSRVDHDGDGYRAEDILSLETEGWSDCHYKLYYKLANQSNYRTYTTTDHHILDPSHTFTIQLGKPNDELTHGIYDFKLELYNTNTKYLVHTYDQNTDPELNDQKFEKASEDNSTPSAFNLNITQSGLGTGWVKVHNQLQRLPFSEQAPTGTVITLEAVPTSYSVFPGWSEASTSTNPIINLTLDANKDLNAIFDLAPPYPNMVRNAEFSDGTNEWYFFVLSPAAAEGVVQNGEFVVHYTDGGTLMWHVQLIKWNLAMEYGKTYHVLYDAYASATKYINAWAGKDEDPWTSYSGAHLDTITTLRTRYDYDFTMNQPTDSTARLIFDIGLTTLDLHFDNMVLIKKINASVVESIPLTEPQKFNLTNYPNPFNTETRICYELPNNCRIKLAVYDLLGHEVQKLVEESKSPGLYEVNFNAGYLPSGVYFYRLTTTGTDGMCYQQTKKLMLMK